MIRFAKKSDTDSMISLWNEAFGDSEEDIRFFLDNRFVPENTVVYEEDESVVSMLFLLEGNLVLNNKSYPSYYLYAACTAESCRGRGIMARLLEKAKEVAAERSKCYICLMPGEKSLFDFYERFGYKSIFSRKIIYINSSQLKEVCLQKENDSLKDYESLRRNAFGNFNRFDWDNSSVEFACKHHKLYGGKCFLNCKGYALYSVGNNNVSVKEFAFHPHNFTEAVRMLLSETGMSQCTIILPADYPTDIGKYETVKSAMALAVKNEYKSYIDGIENAYLGLTLD